MKAVTFITTYLICTENGAVKFFALVYTTLYAITIRYIPL